MKDFLSKVLSSIKVKYADIRIEERDSFSISYRGKDIDSVAQKSSRGACVRVFEKGNWGVVVENNLTEENLIKALKKAKEIANSLPERRITLKPLPPVESINHEPELRKILKIPAEEKRRLIERYNKILLSGKGVVSTYSGYSEVRSMKFFYSTEDRYIEEERIYSGIALSSVASDGTNIQSYHKYIGKQKDFDYLKNREEEAEEVVKITLELLKADKVMSGVYDVIIDPILGGVFIHEAFGHLSEADHIQENTKLKRMMKIGKQYGPEILNAVDDPTLKYERGYYIYDDEGVEARKKYLIKEGKIAGHLHSRETAYIMKEEPTGNARSVGYSYPPIVRMSNTLILPGESSFEELIDVERGLYVVGAKGGMTQLESFTFSSQYAYIIEKGKIKNMVRDVILSGNVFETLHNIDAIGDDLRIEGGGCGKEGQSPLPVGTGSPHIRIRNVVIGGK